MSQKHRPHGRVEQPRKIAPTRQVERQSQPEAPKGRDAARPLVQPKESRVSARLATIFRMMDEGFAILPLVEGDKKPAIARGALAASKNKAAREASMTIGCVPALRRTKPLKRLACAGVPS